MALSSKRIWPAVGRFSMFSVRITVDFPEPDRPMITKTSPRFTLKLTSQSATVTPVSRRTSSLERPSFIIRDASVRFAAP